MTGISVMINMQVPEVHTARLTPQAPRKLCVEDRVRDLIDQIEDSGGDNYTAWLTLNKLYSSLCKCKQTPRVRNLKNMIEPVLAKYGYHKVPARSK